MSRGAIILTFTENVNSTFSLKGLTIQAAPSVPCISYTFTDTRHLTPNTPNGAIYTTSLTTVDLNGLRYTALSYSSNANLFFTTTTTTTTGATTGGGAYITMPYGLTYSTFSGSVVPNLKLTQIRDTAGFGIRIYTPDVSNRGCVYTYIVY